MLATISSSLARKGECGPIYAAVYQSSSPPICSLLHLTRAISDATSNVPITLNADFNENERVILNTRSMTSEPMTGVERKMLERSGGEVARGTRVVRYSPGSSFSRHSHGRGEEIFVLEGIFFDASQAF